MTTLRIYEQEVEGVEFPGLFVAVITDNNNKVKMEYDLSKQESTIEGYYVNNAVVFMVPHKVTYYFDVEYKLDSSIDEVIAFLKEKKWVLVGGKGKV